MNHEIAFMLLSYLQEKDIEVERERYEKMYQGTVADEPSEDLLECLHLKFNTDIRLISKDTRLASVTL